MYKRSYNVHFEQTQKSIIRKSLINNSDNLQDTCTRRHSMWTLNNGWKQLKDDSSTRIQFVTARIPLSGIHEDTLEVDLDYQNDDWLASVDIHLFKQPERHCRIKLESIWKLDGSNFRSSCARNGFGDAVQCKGGWGSHWTNKNGIPTTLVVMWLGFLFSSYRRYCARDVFQ